MFVSIISPSFNQARFLKQMLQSVEQQSFKEYEHIILDPGSTDGSVEILNAYAVRNRSAQVRIESDQGQVDAINNGLRQAKGDVLIWLNSDDFLYDSEVLAQVVAEFEQNSAADIVYGRGVRVDSAGEKIKEAYIQRDDSHILDHLQRSIGILQPALYFRRRVYEAIGCLNPRWPLQLDYEYWIRMAQHGCHFHFYDRLLAKATVHKDAKSTAQRLAQLDECLHLIREKFGVVPKEWIARFAQFCLTQRDAKVESDIAFSETQATLARKLTVALDLEFNQGINKQAISKTECFASNRTRRIVVTAFDSQYFRQGLNLIASIHRTSFESIDALFVYGLNLTDHEVWLLEHLEKVEVRCMPDDWRQRGYPEILDAKSRGYKPLIFSEAQQGLERGDLVLWVDAGISLLQDIDKIFQKIEDEHFFITDHDESRHWPFYNINFMHEKAVARFNPTNEELLSLHYCSAIVGYSVQGRYSHIIQEYAKWGEEKEVMLWPKFAPESEKRKITLTSQEKEKKSRLQALPEDADQVSRSELYKLYPFYGHRTQAALSILVHRYSAPVSSSAIYRRGNEKSTQASAENWKLAAKKTDREASRLQLDGVDESCVAFHHRGTYDCLDGLKWMGSERPIIILGNGPSLKDVDLASLTNFDALGMNAAYRYWDQIGWYPKFYACLDTVVLDSHHDNILRLIENRAEYGIEVFFLRASILDRAPQLASVPSVIFLESYSVASTWFDRDKITTGSFSILFALFIGYREIFFHGVDLNYVEKLPEAREKGRELVITETPKENPNYFFEGYQAAGDRYNPPNRHDQMHLRSWQDVAAQLKGFPAKVCNLNINSAVTFFEFAELETLEKTEVE